MPLDPSFLKLPITHRGLHGEGRIENSRSAFQAAIDHGYAIECDLQYTGDDGWIVFHDYDLERLTGEVGKVRDKSLEEMRAHVLKNGEHPQSFDELLRQVNAKVPLLVEIKDPTQKLAPTKPMHAQSIIKAVKSYAGPIALMSFNPFLCYDLKRLWPEGAIGRTTDDFLCDDWPKLSKDTAEYCNIIHDDLDFISHNWRDLDRVAHLKMPKLCWTIQSQEEEQIARQIADNVTFEKYFAKLA